MSNDHELLSKAGHGAVRYPDTCWTKTSVEAIALHPRRPRHPT